VRRCRGPCSASRATCLAQMNHGKNGEPFARQPFDRWSSVRASIAGMSRTVDDQSRAGCRNRRHLVFRAALPSAVVGAWAFAWRRSGRVRLLARKPGLRQSRPAPRDLPGARPSHERRFPMQLSVRAWAWHGNRSHDRMSCPSLDASHQRGGPIILSTRFQSIGSSKSIRRRCR